MRPKIVLALSAFVFLHPASADTRLSDYVRPMVGTQGEGNTFPGPSAPFGMVQLSPDTDPITWATASGYEYTDPSIMGFSMTHLSGTGIPELGDFLFVPQTGEPKLDPGPKDKPDEGYRSRFSHDQETASAGYYQVKLLDSGVNAEMTAGLRSGMLRFTFPEGQSSILTDLHHFLTGDHFKMIWSHLRVEDGSTITGMHLVDGWAKERQIFFAAKFSRPFDSYKVYSDGKEVKYDSYKTYRFRSSREVFGNNLRFLAEYDTKADEVIQVKIGISPVSVENAMANLDGEIPEWDFDGLMEKTKSAWDAELAKLQLTEGSQEQKETFYTALYHCFMAPTLYQDANGEYRGLDREVHQAEGFTNHTVFSLWDTFRATHPLFCLIQPKRNVDMINSMLAHYDQSADHMLPIWSLQSGETWCMIGYHSVPVIVDAMVKGLEGFDKEHAYEAVMATATHPEYDGIAAYEKLGYVPFDLENESVSKTLEYAYDDYCVARMAELFGKEDDQARFEKRAASYKNLYDPETGLMRGKDSTGKWREDFNPHEYVQMGDFTEGTSWQYTWHVQQDVEGLAELMGGKEAFVAKLDQLFTFHDDETTDMEDVQGRIGEYWHGNEPAHHVLYMYAVAGQPWKGQEKIRHILKTQYGNRPDALTGNDDCGQMSAWYLFSSLGFYPMCPASDSYVFGSPSIEHAVMDLGNGRKLDIKAENQGDANVYIQSVEVNGKPWTDVRLPYAEIKDGGNIVYHMGPAPSQWGAGDRVK
ncbi:GH92 family glycosyl hydrolase [Haloferula sargassicola]|uniref:Alpha-1,2-mannosidase n=1 Tax=Haloferula sargassicola TaxID=490096 RepID=A0ABP9UN52_9BACT